MTHEEEAMAKTIVRIFENVILTEEKSLSQGYFSDLSIAEMHTLTAIGPYEAKTMSNTAAELGITTGTLTVSIDRLVRKGYVNRKRDDKDKRIVRISLTRNGKLACRMHSKFHRVLAKRVLEPYDEEKRKMLIGLVNDIDDYVTTQLIRYEESDSIRKTAKEVASESRSKKDNE